MSSSSYETRHQNKYAVNADKWDFHKSDIALNTSKDLNAAQRRLSKGHATGAELMRDIFHSFVKVAPELKQRPDVRSSHYVNHTIVNEIMKMEDYDTLRKMSVGDIDGSSLAAATLEPDIEVIFDKMKKAEEMAQRLAEKLDQLEALEGEPNAQDMIDKLNEEIQEMESELRDEVDGQAAGVADQLRDTMEKLADQAEAEELAKGWGLEPGTLGKMPYKTRLELGERLSTEEFRRMAEVIGRFQRIAMSVVEHKKVDSFEEIFDIKLGSSIDHMLASEALTLTDDDLFLDFVRRYMDGSLLQYDLKGTESVSKGGIIYIEDGSGSMGGEPAIWAKAIGLALLKIAQVQHREFHVIHFGGPGQFVVFDFDTSGDELVLNFKDKTYRGFEAMLEFAEVGFRFGGTCFMTPLNEAMRILKEENELSGAVQADIIFSTDGQAGVTSTWMAEYEAVKEELAFKTYGFAIGPGPDSEPLASICDAVATPKQLLDGTDLAELFGRL